MRFQCERCTDEVSRVLMVDFQMVCQRCRDDLRGDATRGTSVLDDTINEWNEHVAHEPVHFTSRSEKRLYLKQHGLQEFVRHVGQPGSDKSDKTSRWI